MKTLAAAVGLIACGIWTQQSAHAGELEFRIQSNHPNVVSVEFFSMTRNRVWPGGGEVYIIDDWDVHSFLLSCQYGEKICYGAWVRNRGRDGFWGVGPTGKEGRSVPSDAI